MQEILLKTDIPELPLYDQGKIRDVYHVGGYILVVTTDRVYLFDHVYPLGMEGKGRVLTALTLHAFKICEDIVPSFLVTSQVNKYPLPLSKYPDMFKGRSMLTRKISPIRVECVGRGYLYGQAWASYNSGDHSWLPRLATGLSLGAELPNPIFTPARKDLGNNDENLGWGELVKHVGEQTANELKCLTLKLYERLREFWAGKGFILADTKFEFGELEGNIVLINEACTPDCSRFWKSSYYQPGIEQDSWDKEILENYLREKGWSTGDPPLQIPTELMSKATDRFQELLSLVD